MLRNVDISENGFPPFPLHGLLYEVHVVVAIKYVLQKIKSAQNVDLEVTKTFLY